MPTVADRLATRFVDDAGFLMSNLGSEDTGVAGTVIWFSAGEFSRTDSQRGPRIQVAVGEKLTLDSLVDSVAVTLTIPPQVLGTLPAKMAAQVVEFTERNRDVLSRHWRGEIDTGDVLERLERV